MFQSFDKNIKMPKISSGQGIEDNKVVVSITKDARFFVNGAPVNVSGLEASLASIIKNDSKKIIIVKADAQTKNKEIMKVLRAATNTGYEKLTVAGEPLTGKHQEDLKKS